MLVARLDGAPEPIRRPSVCGVMGEREVGALFLFDEDILLKTNGIQRNWDS